MSGIIIDMKSLTLGGSTSCLCSAIGILISTPSLFLIERYSPGEPLPKNINNSLTALKTTYQIL
jgi:hypothetical protein